MATLKEQVAELTKRVEQLEQAVKFGEALYEAGIMTGERRGREAVLGPQPAPKSPRHLKSV